MEDSIILGAPRAFQDIIHNNCHIDPQYIIIDIFQVLCVLNCFHNEWNLKSDKSYNNNNNNNIIYI